MNGRVIGEAGVFGHLRASVVVGVVCFLVYFLVFHDVVLWIHPTKAPAPLVIRHPARPSPNLVACQSYEAARAVVTDTGSIPPATIRVMTEALAEADSARLRQAGRLMQSGTNRRLLDRAAGQVAQACRRLFPDGVRPAHPGRPAVPPRVPAES
jgi:hypothetical protein